MVNVLVVFFVICVSFGPAYNIVGDLGIFIFMLGIILFSKRKKIDRRLLPSLIVFNVLIVYKTIGMNNSQALSVYHSAYGVVNTAIKLIIFIFFLDILIPIFKEYRYKICSLFNVCFHISIFISIIILIKTGRDTYRVNISAGGLLLAPQIYITMSIFMVMALIYLIIQKKEKREIQIALVAMNIFYLFMANYTTQLIFGFLGMIVIFILGYEMKKSNKVILSGIIIVLAVVMIPMIPNIIEVINDTFFATNETVNVRLEEIVLLLRGQNIQGTDLKGRFDLMKLSFESFKNNPVLGIPFSSYNTKMTGLVVGGHSEWSDDLARYGVVGMIIFGWFLFESLYMILQYKNCNNISFKRAVIIIILLYGFSNPIIRYMEFVFLFFVTMLVDVFSDKMEFFNEEII